MKRAEIFVLAAIAAVLGFFVATAADRTRYIASIVPALVVLIIAFRPRKKR